MLCRNVCLFLCNTNTNSKTGSILNYYEDTSLDTGIWKFVFQHGTVQLPKPDLELSVNSSNDFISHCPWTLWKRWNVKRHHWKVPGKFLCKSHSFFYSCAVPPNEQTREMLSKWWWWGCLFGVVCLLLSFFCKQKLH